MPNVRIKDQTTDTALTTGDYVIVDSETEGTRKYDLGALAARVEALEQGGSGLSQTEKNLILTLFSKAAYAENDAETAYDALEAMWTHASYSVSWSGSNYTKSNPATTVIEGSTYTSTITANAGYNISNVTVTMGGATVTGAWSGGQVTIPNVTGDIVITVTTASAISSISAVYTQTGAIYTDDTLDDLKSDLVVTATYSDSTTSVVTDYTLSGSLTAGTSTITVSYGGKTTTFNVTVTAPLYSIPDFAETTVLYSSKYYKVSKANGYFTVSGDSTGAFYVPPTGEPTITRPTAQWFSTSADDKLSYKIKDISWNNPTGTAIDLTAKFSRADTDGNIYQAQFTMSANGSGSEGNGEYSSQGITNGRTLSAVALQFSNNPGNNANVTATFKLEFYVNDVRYL